MLLIACNKDDPGKPGPIPEPNIPVYVPAGKRNFLYGYGSGSGYKNGNKFYFTTATWDPPPPSDDTLLFILYLNTFEPDPDSIFLREDISFNKGFAPNEKGYFDKRPLQYILFIDGGDVGSQDDYDLDTTRPYFVNIAEADYDKNIIRGNMEAHFNLRDTVNKQSKKSPNHVHFTEMYFETKYRK